MTAIYGRSAIEIVKRAFRLIRVIDGELPIEAQERENGFEALNCWVKSMQTDGFNLWRESEAVLPLEKGKTEYKLGANGDRCASSDDFKSTLLSADVASGDTLINLADNTGINGAPALIGYNPATELAGWTVTDGNLSASANGLVVEDTTGAAVAEFNLITEKDVTYIVQSDIELGQGNTVTISATDINGTLDSSVTNVNGTVRLVFTARQKVTTFRFENGGTVAGSGFNNLPGFNNLNQSATTSSTSSNTINSLTQIDKSKGDKIGLFLNDGSVFWSNVIYSNPFEIAEPLPDDVDNGNVVYSYSENINRPLSVVNLRYKDAITTTEIPTTNWTRQQYFDQPDKNSKGIVTKWYYSPQLELGSLYVWQPASSNKALLNISYIRAFDVTTENADKPDFPSEWFELMCYGVADTLSAEYDVPEKVLIKVTQKYQELYDRAMGFDNDGVINIQIDYEGTLR